MMKSNSNRAQTIIAQIDELFEEPEVELLEGSLNEKDRFSLRAYNPTTQQSLFKANASNKDQIRSLLKNAAKHVRDGGMGKIRVTVHDQKRGMFTNHTLTRVPNGEVHTSHLDHIDSFED